METNLLRAIREVLAGKGLSATAKAYGINKAELSISVKAFKICLNSNLNKDLEESSLIKLAVFFMAGYMIGMLVFMFISWKMGLWQA